ncbi:FliH/SctL family protein [Alkaliphilus transvaalensis]|uniref:FliH/SctL family protein n=1 Tax=Alkaliphilus transvaalensis TaxID=114628 RepID=UPI00047A4BB3|nr:FliH/SctL family protein [Alkaliphilus transvaalensis]
MSKPRVFKSTNIVIGEKKEISLAELENLIKLKQEEFQKIEEEPQEELNLEEISQQAEALLTEAQEESTRIVEAANEEAQLILQEAYNDSQGIFEKAKRDGYEAGLIEGNNKGYQEVEKIIQEACEIKQQAILDKEAMAKEMEKEIIQLVISTVRKVIDHEVKEDQELLLNLIKEGLKKSTFSESLIIRVSEVDYDLVNSAKNKIYMMTDGIEKLEIKCEPSMEAGSVLIDTVSGTIDSSIETQIKTVEKLFYELLQSE